MKLSLSKLFCAFLLVGGLSATPAFAEGHRDRDRHDQRHAIFSQLDRGDDALVHAQKAVEMTERLLGPNHPQLAEPLVNLGLLKTERGEVAEAEKLVTTR